MRIGSGFRISMLSGCVASTASCVIPAPPPTVEGARPTQNLRCDPACCDGTQTFVRGHRAICACPATVDAQRQDDWDAAQIAAALEGALENRSELSECALLQVWAE